MDWLCSRLLARVHRRYPLRVCRITISCAVLMANSGVVSIEPSLLLVGFGGIIGIRAGVSLFVGAIIAWGGIAPWLLRQGIVEPSDGGGASLFGPLVEWLLWPGVSLLVTATLTMFAVRAVGVLQAASRYRQSFATQRTPVGTR
jgi:uncharacterized oligopeptide transporter (OPT) family protein